MYINTIFILYGIAILISLVCLVFIGLIFVRKNDRSNRTYMAVRSFAVVVMLTDMLYFIFYYREVVQEKFELVLPFRLVDYTLCTAIFFFWILILGHILNDEKYHGIIKLGTTVNVIRLIASLAVTSIFMGEYYNIENSAVCTAWTIAEFVFILLTAVIIIYCTIRVLTESTSSLRKKYSILVSALVLLWSGVQGVVDMGLFAGDYGVSAWALETPDFTGAILFLINLATCIFVFKEDFSPLFFSSQEASAAGSIDRASVPPTSSPKDEEAALTEKLDAIAASHKLTVREREVMELIYRGYTNPDIGEKLFITINTVKKHTHNVFEKLDVSNRMEVAHLINSWKNK